MRERLQVLVLAITKLEATATPAQINVIRSARAAIDEIALLVGADEHDESHEPKRPAEIAAQTRVRSRAHPTRPSASSALQLDERSAPAGDHNSNSLPRRVA